MPEIGGALAVAFYEPAESVVADAAADGGGEEKEGEGVAGGACHEHGGLEGERADREEENCPETVLVHEFLKSLGGFFAAAEKGEEGFAPAFEEELARAVEEGRAGEACEGDDGADRPGLVAAAVEEGDENELQGDRDDGGFEEGGESDEGEGGGGAVDPVG